jgi:hypothetical protein
MHQTTVRIAITIEKPTKIHFSSVSLFFIEASLPNVALADVVLAIMLLQKLCTGW